jgi:hypothetical protein
LPRAEDTSTTLPPRPCAITRLPNARQMSQAPVTLPFITFANRSGDISRIGATSLRPEPTTRMSRAAERGDAGLDDRLAVGLGVRPPRDAHDFGAELAALG